MNPKKIIKALRRQIPQSDIACPPGCNDCCGPVIVSKWELEQIGGKFINYDDPASGGTFIDYNSLQTVKLSDIWVHPDIIEKFHSVYGENPVCQFHNGTGCSVYRNRPLVCRLFPIADIPLCQCPRGCKSENLISIEKKIVIWGEYIKMIKKGG